MTNEIDILGLLLTQPTAEEAEEGRILREKKRQKIQLICQPKKREIRCPRCGGRGQLDHFNHISNGICFKCGGTGIIN